MITPNAPVFEPADFAGSQVVGTSLVPPAATVRPEVGTSPVKRGMAEMLKGAHCLAGRGL